ASSGIGSRRCGARTSFWFSRTAASRSRARSASWWRAAGCSPGCTGPSSEGRTSVPSRRESLLILGIVGQYPMAGVAWQAVHYLLGFQALGWDAYYVEDSGAPPYDPRAGGVTGESSYAVSYVPDVIGRVGL